jgi:hypothetical protein
VRPSVLALFMRRVALPLRMARAAVRYPPDPVRSKYSNVLRPWVMSPRPERLWENVTRPILDRVTLCYVRFECFSLLRNSGIINGSEISNLQNWTVGLGASRKNAFGPEGWAAIPACFIPICAGACACMGHSYETPELLMAQKSATCKIGPSDLVPLEKTPSALRDGLQSPPVSSPSVLARAPAWAIG